MGRRWVLWLCLCLNWAVHGAYQAGHEKKNTWSSLYYIQSGMHFQENPTQPQRSMSRGNISRAQNSAFYLQCRSMHVIAPQSHKSQLKHPTLGPEIPLKVVALFKKTLVQMVQICPLQWKKRCFSQTVFFKEHVWGPIKWSPVAPVPEKPQATQTPTQTPTHPPVVVRLGNAMARHHAWLWWWVREKKALVDSGSTVEKLTEDSKAQDGTRKGYVQWSFAWGSRKLESGAPSDSLLSATTTTVHNICI